MTGGAIGGVTDEQAPGNLELGQRLNSVESRESVFIFLIWSSTSCASSLEP